MSEIRLSEFTTESASLSVNSYVVGLIEDGGNYFNRKFPVHSLMSDNTTALNVAGNAVSLDLSDYSNFVISVNQDVNTINLDNAIQFKRHLVVFRNTGSGSFAVDIDSLGLQGGPEDSILLLENEILALSLFAVDAGAVVVLGWNII